MLYATVCCCMLYGFVLPCVHAALLAWPVRFQLPPSFSSLVARIKSTALPISACICLWLTQPRLVTGLVAVCASDLKKSLHFCPCIFNLSAFRAFRAKARRPTPLSRYDLSTIPPCPLVSSLYLPTRSVLLMNDC
jgi:hypothetical protein